MSMKRQAVILILILLSFTGNLGAQCLIITNPAPVCSPATVDLTAPEITAGSSATSFTYWTDLAATISYSTPTTATAGTYYIQGDVGTGCPDVQPVIVTVDPVSAGGDVTGGTTVCSGSTSGVLTLSGHTGIIVKWESSVSPFSTWTDITNTADTYTSGALTQTTEFRAVVQSGSCSPATSTATTVTVDPVSVGGSVTGGTVICSGSTSGLLTLSGHTGTILKWESSVSPFSTWTDISNTGTTHTSGPLTQTTEFRAVVQSGSCPSLNSASTTVTVDPESAGGSVSGGAAKCSGSTSGLLTLSGQTGTVVKWQSSVSPFSTWNDISNTGTTYTSGALTQTTEFRAVVQSGVCPSANSTPTTITVDPVSAGGSVTGGTVICSGSTSGLLTLSGHTGTVLKWQSSVSPFSTWTDISNTGTTYTSIALTQTTEFRAVVQSGVCSSANSLPTTVTVDPVSAGGNVTGGTTICSGSTSGLLTLSGHTGTVVKWESSVSPFSTWTDIANTGTTYTSGPLTQTTEFRAVVQSGVCPAANSSSQTVIVTPDNTITLSSGAGTNNQTPCINTPLSTITFTTTGAAGASFSGLPAGVTGVWGSNIITISGSPSVAGSFPYTVTLTGGCGTISGSGTITVTNENTISLSSGAGTNNQTACISAALTAITFATTGATGATFSGLPLGVTGIWASNTVTISGTPSVSGSFPYIVTLTGGCGTATANGTVTVTPYNTITLSSGAGTNNQTRCINTALTAITFSTTGATGANSSGLPPGVTAVFATNVVTISGAPSLSGSFPYTITLTGGCGTVSAGGTITVTPGNTITLTSGAGTNNQTRCISTAITAITFSTTGATGATVTGLPSGVSGVWASNVVTISGTPSVSGSFPYTVALSGGCGTVTSTGTLTITPDNTITLSSGAGTNNQTRCINTALTAITFTTTGATGITVSGLPLGVTGIWASNVVTISGTPSVSGSFPYTISLTSGCGTVTETGTITVTPVVGTPGTPTPSASVICQNSPNTVYTASATNATGYNWTVTGTGNIISGTGTTGTVNWAAGFSGSATVSVTANGCSGPSAPASTTVTVRPTPLATISGTTSVCQNAAAPDVTFTNPMTLPIIVTYNINGTVQPTIAVAQSSSVSVAASTTSAGVFVYNLVSAVYQAAPACSNNLSQSATVTVNALPAPTLSSSDGDNIFCAGTSVTFTAGGGTSYNFRVGGVSVQDGAASTYTTASLSNGKSVDVIVTSANGCKATSGSIINFVDALPFIFISTPAFCSADLSTYSLAVAVSAGIVTASSGNVTNTGGNIWSITGVASGVNVNITVTDGNSCENVLVVNYPNCSCPFIQPPGSGGDKTYCAGGTIPTISATVSGGETVDWYNSASGGVLLRSGNLSYTPTSAGLYYAQTRNTTSGCVSTSRTAISVIMNALPVPSLSSSDLDNNFCAGTSVTFTAGGGTSYNFRVGGLSVQNSSLATYTTSTLITGQIVDVIVTNASGCSATSSGIVNKVNSFPTPALFSSDADNNFCAGTAITFYAGGGNSYNFRIGGISVQNGTSSDYTTNSLTNGQIVDVVVTSVNGCSVTSASISNTVYSLPAPVLTSSDPDNTFCEGTSITFTSSGGINYDFSIAGQSKQGGSLSTFTTNSLTNGQVVDVIITNSNGCSIQTAGITNTVNAIPVADAGAGGNECDLNFILSAVPSVGIGTWTKTAGPGTAIFAPNANTPTATVTVSEYGTYTFTWTELNTTCSSNAAIVVSFYQQPVADAGTGGNNCGTEFFLNASPSVGAGTWTKTTGPGTVSFTPNASTPNASVTVSDYGNYTFKWTEVNGTCSSSASILVNFLQVPAANAGNDGSECDLDYILNAVPTSGAGTGLWAKLSGPGDAIFSPDANKPDARVTVNKYGEYQFMWTEANISCQSTDLINVVFHELPIVSAGRDTVICRGESVQLDAAGEGSYTWMPDSIVSDPNIKNPIATPLSTSLFNVTITDQNGCKNTDTLLIQVLSNPVVYAGPDQELDYVFKTNMAASAPLAPETGKWTVISATGILRDLTDPVTSLSQLSLGENIYLWTVTNGVCPPVSDSVKIIVKDFKIPTLITPNMDGKNDYFVLRGIESLGKTDLTIFDRRGTQVYQNSNYDNKWNGVDYDQNPLPADTYFFVLKTVNGKSMSGYIVIRR
jgi:gliding motility-associated-like protein